MSKRRRIWDGQIVPFVPSQTPACEGVDAAIRSDAGYGPTREAPLALQKEMCAGCPVLRECMSHALDNEPYGLWGLTEAQRWDLGGVVPQEWGRYEPQPQRAYEELSQSGIPLDLVRGVVSETQPRPKRPARRRGEVA